MPLYEVYIPAKAGSNNQNVTIKIEAPSWLLALRSGMQQIGDQGDSLRGVICENQADGSVIVKDPGTRRIFKISVVSQASSADNEEKQKQAEIEAQKAREEAERLAKEQEELRKQLEAKQRQQAEMIEKLRREKEEADRLAAAEARAKEDAEARRKREEEAKAAAAKQAAQMEIEKKRLEAEMKEKKDAMQRASAKAAELSDGVAGKVDITYDKMEAVAMPKTADIEEETPFDPNEALADLFEKTIDLPMMEEQEAIDYLMDLAMEVVPSESGSIILSDYSSPLHDLYFAAARGPVANKILKMRIPRSKGFVGFSVSTGVSLAISDVNKNPNWFRDIAAKTGYETRSLLCVPISYDERTLGVVQLINKKGSNKWSSGEMNVIAFVCDKVAEILKRRSDEIDISKL